MIKTIKLSSIKSTFLEWLKNNLEKLLVVLIVAFACLYAMYRFQDVIDGQKSVVSEIQKQNEIHKIELEKVTKAYIVEQKALKENIRVYRERIAEINKEYEADTDAHEINKNSIATTIVEESDGDPSKVAEAVSDATGFLNESN